jgi:hypothetical protein
VILGYLLTGENDWSSKFLNTVFGLFVERCGTNSLESVAGRRFSNLDELGPSTVSPSSPFRDVGRITELPTIKAQASLLTYAWDEFFFIHTQVVSHISVSPGK